MKDNVTAFNEFVDEFSTASETEKEGMKLGFAIGEALIAAGLDIASFPEYLAYRDAGMSQEDMAAYSDAPIDKIRDIDRLLEELGMTFPRMAEYDSGQIFFDHYQKRFGHPFTPKGWSSLRKPKGIEIPPPSKRH